MKQFWRSLLSALKISLVVVLIAAAVGSVLFAWNYFRGGEAEVSVPTLPPHTRFGAGFRPFSASLTNYTVRASFARTRKFCGKDNYFFIPFKKFTFN